MHSFFSGIPSTPPRMLYSRTRIPPANIQLEVLNSEKHVVEKSEAKMLWQHEREAFSESVQALQQTLLNRIGREKNMHVCIEGRLRVISTMNKRILISFVRALIDSYSSQTVDKLTCKF